MGFAARGEQAASVDLLVDLGMDPDAGGGSARRDDRRSGMLIQFALTRFVVAGVASSVALLEVLLSAL